MAHESLRLSVVIPTFNGLHWLRRSLPRVLVYAPRGTEVIIVDDGSDDGTEQWIRQSGWPVRYIRRSSNGGFCAAINDGILAARAPVVETLNNDALVTPGWTIEPLGLFRDRSVGAVAPLVLQMARLSRVDSAGDGWHLCGRAFSRFNRCETGDGVLEPAEVFGVSACAGFFRREAVLKAGLFPTSYVAYYDDVDLSFRLRYAGYRCLYCPGSVVVHAVHGSYGQITASTLRRMARNEELTFWSNTPRSVLPLAIPLHVLYVLLQSLTHIRRPDRFVAYWSGRLDVLRWREEVKERRAQLPRSLSVHDLAERLKVDASVRSFLKHLVAAAARRLPTRAREGETPWESAPARDRRAA